MSPDFPLDSKGVLLTVIPESEMREWRLGFFGVSDDEIRRLVFTIDTLRAERQALETMLARELSRKMLPTLSNRQPRPQPTSVPGPGRRR